MLYTSALTGRGRASSLPEWLAGGLEALEPLSGLGGYIPANMGEEAQVRESGGSGKA